MSAIAKLRYLHIPPRKVRLVADLIRGKTAEQAQAILNFTVKKASKPLLKLLKSCLANAKDDSQFSEDNLYISKITVDQGPKYKRWRARSRGQAFEIQKRTSHVTLVLDEIKKRGVAKKKRIGKKGVKMTEIKTEKKVEKIQKPGLKSKIPKIETKKIKMTPGLKRVFRRKAF